MRSDKKDETRVIAIICRGESDTYNLIKIQKIPHVAGFLEDPFSDKWYEDYTVLVLPVNSVIMDQ